jgi:hypothetical protein
MNLSRAARSAASRTKLADALMDGYVTWREQSAAVHSAYQRWERAARHEREIAFDEYIAALDREEWAATAYRQLTELAEAPEAP